MYRKFGKWPTDEWMQIPEKDRQEFFRNSDGCSSDELVSKAKNVLEGYTVKEKFYSNGGSFLPLGVWKSKGYNPEDIEANSKQCDIGWCSVVGRTYRVPILCTGDRGSTGTKESEHIEKPKPIKKKNNQVAEPENSSGAASSAAASVPESEKSSSSSDSSSSSSSSSSSHKKKKKDKSKKSKKKKTKKSKKNKDKKESPAERKARENLEKARAKEEEKRQNVKKTLASSIKSKVSGGICAIESTFAKPMSKDLPEMMKKSARTILDELKGWDSDATNIIADPTKPIDLPDIKTVGKLAQDAKKIDALLHSCLATLEKVGS